MARFTIPPLTRVLLLLLIVLSSVVAILRYYTYILLMAEATRKEMEQAAAAAIASEKGLAVDPKQTFPVPLPSDFFVPYLTVVPGLSTVYPWVLFTSSFVEGNILSFLFTGSVLLYSGRYCEHVWGIAELARFVGLQTIIPNIVSVLVYLLLFSSSNGIDSATGDSKSLETISGALALVAGFFVAFKQMVPEHTVILFRGALKIRVARLPAIFLLFYTLFGVLFRSEVRLVQAWTGFFVSWIYLRFFRVSYVDPPLPFSSSSASTGGPAKSTNIGGGPSTGSPLSSLNNSSSNLTFGLQSGSGQGIGAQAGMKVKGDLSDSFALAQFFPEPLATAVSIVSEYVFNALVAVRICSPFDPFEVDTSNLRAASRATGGSYVMSNSNYHYMRPFGSNSPSGSSGSNYMPQRGSARAEAERRRALALKALDSQLGRHTTRHHQDDSQVSNSLDGVPPPDLKLPNRAVLPPARVN